jgi:hypothetical protein
MSYVNPKQLLDAATALPAAIEAKLPEGAPAISTKLLEFNTDVISKLPDFPMEIPDLPALPEFITTPPEPTAARARYVSRVEVRPTPPEPTTTRSLAKAGQVTEMRGI